MNRIIFSPQNIFMAIYLGSSLIFMTFINALAAQRIPLQKALPDVVHDLFDVAAGIREAPGFGRFQFSNRVCLIFAIILVSSLFTMTKYVNARKVLFLYSTMAFFRGLSFWITSLPPPCTGLPECPCADAYVIAQLKAANPMKIALSWLTGLGMLSRYPQCGDLIISGHTMFLWLAMRYLNESFQRAFSPSLTATLTSIILVIILCAVTYIVIVRNHYTIDIVLGVFIPELLWTVYTGIEREISEKNCVPATSLGKFVKWFEYRMHPLPEKRKA